MNKETNNHVSLRQNAEAVLASKAKEYAHGSRFSNFETACQLTERAVIACIHGMALKHFVSILDIIEGRLTNETLYLEKFGDAYNYVCLAIAYLENDHELLNVQEEPSLITDIYGFIIKASFKDNIKNWLRIPTQRLRFLKNVIHTIYERTLNEGISQFNVANDQRF